MDIEEQDDVGDELVEVEEDAERKRIKGSYKSHYGKSLKAINKENRYILGTQAKCMRFIKAYRGHRKICNWCAKSKVPAV